MSARDPERDWIEFWESICTTDTGEIDLGQIKRSLSDYRMVLENVGAVYCHITGGMVSKPHTEASVVIALADDHLDEELEERLNESLAAIQKAH